MLATLPLSAFWLIFFLFYKRGRCWRKSYLSAAIVWGFLLTAITEVLSIFSLVSFAWILGAWVTICGLTYFCICLLYKNSPLSSTVKKLPYELVEKLKKDSFLSFSLFSISIILVLTSVVALYAPPNNYDSMTYHMPRVMNWLQNHSVAHYPTHNLRQLDLSPWSSFAIMNLQILSGSDRFANLVQWFSMAGCLIGASLVAQQLGASLIGQILTSVFCATIPMGILQSVTTQNDYVLSFWLICLVYNTMLISQGEITSKHCFQFGASLGLAILTKATSYIYAFPFFAFWIIFIATSLRTNSFKFFLLGVLPVGILNSGHWWRNYWLFQDLLGVSGDITRNNLLTIEAVISNLARNIALHIPTIYQAANNFFERCIFLFHEHVLRLDVNDPRTTFPGTVFQLPVFGEAKPIYLNEDTVGNPLSLSLVFAVILFYITMPKLRDSRRNIYLFLLLNTVLLFNLLLSWQPWGTRLHLPFFILISPFVGDVLSKVINSLKLSYILVFILTCGALPYVFFSSFRPILQSSAFATSSSIFNQEIIEIYFNARPDLKDQYIQSKNLVLTKNCYDVGLYSNENSWEYPLWISLNRNELPGKFKLHPVSVDNASKIVTLNNDNSSLPCAIFAVDRYDVDSVMNLSGHGGNVSVSYIKALTNNDIQVYLRRD